jgi:hypothetical protein
VLDHDFGGSAHDMTVQAYDYFNGLGACCPELPQPGAAPEIEICAVDPTFPTSNCQ